VVLSIKCFIHSYIAYMSASLRVLRTLQYAATDFVFHPPNSHQVYAICSRKVNPVVVFMFI